MKKIAIIAVAAMVTGIASADLAVAWKNTAGAVTAPSGGSSYLVGSTVQLLWSAAGAVTTAGSYNNVNGALLAGEQLLDSTISGVNSSWNLPGETFAGDYSGGAFFTRFFQSDGAGGEFFLDVEMADGADWVFNSKDPTTTYKTDVVAGVLNINQNATTVIPEPATLGLMGVAGLGMFLARKKARR